MIGCAGACSIDGERREVANALRLINEDKFQLIGENDCSRLMELVEEYFCADYPVDAAISG